VSDIKLKHLWATIKYWGGQSNVWSEQGIHKSFDALVTTDGLLHHCKHCSLSVNHHEFYQRDKYGLAWLATDVPIDLADGQTSKWLASGDLGYKCTGALAKKGWLQND